MKNSLIILAQVSLLLLISCKTDDPVTPGENSYKIHGTVYSDDGNTPVEQVKVIIGTDSTSTDSLGYYEIAGVEQSEISLEFIHDDFMQKDTTFVIDSDTNLDIYLTRIERYYSVSGYVLDSENTNRHIDSVLVSLGGSQIYSDTTGYFEFSEVPEGEVVLKFEHNIYTTLDTNITLDSDINLSIRLSNKIPLEERLEALKYFPLAVGNKWEYLREELHGSSITTNKDTLIFSVTVVTDTVLSNKLRYLKLQMLANYSSSWSYPDNFKINDVSDISNIYYYRIDSVEAKIYRIKGSTDYREEKLVENTLLSIGQKYIGVSPWYQEYSFESTYEFTKVIDEKVFGIPTTIRTYSDLSWDYEYRLAKNLGYISSWSHGGSMTWGSLRESLRYAYIEGIEYGTQFEK